MPVHTPLEAQYKAVAAALTRNRGELDALALQRLFGAIRKDWPAVAAATGAKRYSGRAG